MKMADVRVYAYVCKPSKTSGEKTDKRGCSSAKKIWSQEVLAREGPRPSVVAKLQAATRGVVVNVGKVAVTSEVGSTVQGSCEGVGGSRNE